MKKLYICIQSFCMIFFLFFFPTVLHAQISIVTPVPVEPVVTPTPGVVILTPTPIPINTGIITPTPTPFVYETPTPVPRMPDLAVEGVFLFTSNYFLAVKIENEGTGIVYTREGKLSIYSEKKLLETIILEDNPSQWFRNPGHYSYFVTNIRMSSDAGSRRKLAVIVDPDEEIEELDEYQNISSRTISAPDNAAGPDFIISSAHISGNSLIVVVKNRGPQSSVPGTIAEMTVAADDLPEVTYPVTLPLLLPRGMNTVSLPITDPSGFYDYAKISLRIETMDILDEIDNTNNTYDYYNGISDKLLQYENLLSIPAIADTIVWIDYISNRKYQEWSQDQKDELFSVIQDLEQGRAVLPQDPPELSGGYMSESDAWEIYLAHVAHSLWLDVNDKVPWDLSGFSDKELEYLFDVRRLMYHNPMGYRFSNSVMGRVTAWNPQVSYQFLVHCKILRDNQLETLYALTDWMRGHLVHYSSDEHDLNSIYNYPGWPPIDRILYPNEGWPHLTAGCWGTTGIFCALLKSLNIPVKAATIDLGSGTHSRPEFLSLQMSMPHADDVYSSYLTPVGGDMPSSVYFYTMDEMESLFFHPPRDCYDDDCNSRGEQASYNSTKDQINNSLEYGGYYFLYEYAVKGEAYVRDSLRGARIGREIVEYALPFFTPQQIDAKINLIQQRLFDIGGGDREEGKDYVIERMDVFLANR